MSSTIWQEAGNTVEYEHYRQSEHESSIALRKWFDDVLNSGLNEYLDNDFVNSLRNVDFYGRLWELELVEWLSINKFTLMPTNGSGPDFCVKLTDGTKVWIEATLARADDELEQLWRSSFDGRVYNTPRTQIALRYSSSLVTKADKIKEKYAKLLNDKDYMLIAVSAFPPGPMRSDIDLFMLSILPIEHQLVHFSSNGKPLDETVKRPTHSINTQYEKSNGAMVKKEFLYPGTYFPYIDGVIYSEASNLQMLLGSWSSSFDDSTNQPHIFANYSGKKLPSEFLNRFYSHQFITNESIVSLQMEMPVKNT